MAIPRVGTEIHHLGSISLMIVSCLRLVAKAGHASGHTRRMTRVAEDLGLVTGSLGVPIIAYSRLGHRSTSNGNGSRGPAVSRLHRSNSVRRSTSVVLLLCHRSCFSRSGNRDIITSRGGTRIVVTGGHRNNAASISLG